MVRGQGHLEDFIGEAGPNLDVAYKSLDIVEDNDREGAPVSVLKCLGDLVALCRL